MIRRRRLIAATTAACGLAMVPGLRAHAAMPPVRVPVVPPEFGLSWSPAVREAMHRAQVLGNATFRAYHMVSGDVREDANIIIKDYGMWGYRVLSRCTVSFRTSFLEAGLSGRLPSMTELRRSTGIEALSRVAKIGGESEWGLVPRWTKHYLGSMPGGAWIPDRTDDSSRGQTGRDYEDFLVTLALDALAAVPIHDVSLVGVTGLDERFGPAPAPFSGVPKRTDEEMHAWREVTHARWNA